MPTLQQALLGIATATAIGAAYYYNNGRNNIQIKDITRRQVVIATLCTIGIYAVYKIRQFLADIPFAASDDAVTLTKHVDLSNKIIIITGCSSGIGQATLIALSQTNAKIIMAVRNIKKAEKVLNNMDNNDNNKIEIMKLDLSSIKSIDEFVLNYKAKYNKLDILICNAGVAPKRKGMKSKDGYELAVGTNHLGHMNLAISLKKELENADDFGRLIVLSGDIFKWPIYEYNIDRLNTYSTTSSYALSKLLNVMFVNEFNEKYPFNKNNNKSILAVSCHPGVGGTNLMNDRDDNGNVVITLSQRILSKIVSKIGDSMQQLAYTSVYLAIQDIDKLEPGGYYCCKQIWDTNQICKDKAKCAQLWDVSLKYINDARKK